MSDTVFNFLYPIIGTLMLTGNLYILYDKSMFNKTYILYSFIIYFTIFISRSNYNFIYIAFFIISYIYFNKNSYNIVSYLFAYIIIMLNLLVSDALGGLFTTKILNVSYGTFLSDKLLYFFVGTLILIISIVFSILIKKLFIKIEFDINNIYLTKTTKKIVLNVTLLFLIINIIFRFYTLAAKFIIFDKLFFAYICTVLLILLFLLILFFFVCKIINISHKNDFIDKENKQLKEYTDMLEKVSSDLRKFKHDYVNILYTLGDYINEGDIEGLKKYYNEDLLPESKSIVKTDKHITLLKNIKITPLKALVSSKLLAAQSQKIEISAEILEEIDTLSIKTIDICRIIGILLDNAAESAILCKKKFIHFAMIKTEENVIIVIMNSCLKNIPPVYELYKKNFSTKGPNRGIGLTSVKELIDTSYKNILLNTSVNNGVFKQELIINNCRAVSE